MIRRPPRSTPLYSSSASDVYKRQIPYLERGERLMPHDFFIEVAWGRALECMGRREDALKRVQRASKIVDNSTVSQWIGLLYGEMGRTQEAGVALQRAVQLGPRDAAA